MSVFATILRLLLALSRTERGLTVMRHAIVLALLGLLLQTVLLFGASA